MAEYTKSKPMPLTIARARFQESLVELVNGSGLPAFVTIGIIDELRRALEQLAEQQYQHDLQAYNQDTQADGQEKEGA